VGPNAGAVVRIFGSRWSRLQKEDTQKCSRIVSEAVSEGVCEGEEGSQEKRKKAGGWQEDVYVRTGPEDDAACPAGIEEAKCRGAGR